MAHPISSKTCNDERSKLYRIINFKFPYSYRKIGILLGGGLLLALIISKFTGHDHLLNKDLIRTLMLLPLLVAALSEEKVEDEYTSHLRGQSFIIAVVCALAYNILIPLIAFALDVLIVNVSGDGQTSFYDVSSFEVMFSIICFQIVFFEGLKRLDRAE